LSEDEPFSAYQMLSGYEARLQSPQRYASIRDMFADMSAAWQPLIAARFHD
jgi:hypothetical protein